CERVTLGSGLGRFPPDADRLSLCSEPARRAAAASGDRLENRRVEWWPVSVLVLHFSTQRASGPWVRVAGVDVVIAIADFPLVVPGRLELRVGVSRVFDEPTKNRNVAYFSIGVRP